MDIENLNKMQIIMLTLLVSFVTSIATGIVTVTLIDQAPPAVVQTIHKVVEKTVETITPNTQTATIQKEVVVIKEQNMIADVIEKSSESIIKINNEKGFVGAGIIVDKKGIVLTSAGNIKEKERYSFVKGKEILNLELLFINTEKKLAYLKISNPNDSIFKTIFKTAILENSSTLKLGQSVVLLNQSETTEVFTGIISSLVKEDVLNDLIVVDKNNTATTTDNLITETVIAKIKTNLPEGIVKGSALLDIEGNVVGINTDSTNIFITLDFIKDELKTILDLQSQKDQNPLTE
jgi:S1-C subfamily serine protease